MNPDGSYEQRRPDEGAPVVDTQAVLMDAARAAVDGEYGPGVATEYPVEGDVLVGRPADGSTPGPDGGPGASEGGERASDDG